MQFTYKGKKYTIPDSEIKNSMAKLGLTKQEAVKMWLEDEGIEVNAEQAEMTEKAVKSGVQKKMTRTTANKKPTAKRERKADPTKEGLISELAKFLNEYNGVVDVQIENVGKLIGFSLNGEHYTINLIRNRKKK